MHKIYYTIFFSCFILWVNSAQASHMIGGDITYKCVGNNNFEITLTLYQDCLSGEPTAIAQDDPAHYAIYKMGVMPELVLAGSVNSNSTEIVPPGFNNECITNFPNTCLRKQIFIFTVNLAPDPDYGYEIVYQRCCRNASIANINNPGNIGVTYSAYIPPFSSNQCPNNSAVFKNMPPQIICKANPFSYDFSAIDTDGDSLSYELCSAYIGGSSNNPLPEGGNIDPPPFISVPYRAPFSAQMPMSGFPPLQIDPVSGMMTITPNTLGRYVVTVCCHEWRNGQIINTLSRDVQFIVTDCSKAVVANIPQLSTEPNTYIVECNSFTVNFINQSTGGFNYQWDFGDGSPIDTSFEPTHTYADTGTYHVTLKVNAGSTCPDSIMRLVKVYPFFNADFKIDGLHCPGDTIQFNDNSTATYNPITLWRWNFGDGDSSNIQNPKHAYPIGGDYNVQLIAQTIKGCVDTANQTVSISNFIPNAGNDTIVVLGYPFSLNASGGDVYQWLPPDFLSNPNIPNPNVNFPDTGRYTYVVQIANEAGCQGVDTINILVVNDPGIYMPTAFSPNGDGKNDIVKPLLVGYTDLKFFRIFNRFGQLVFETKNTSKGWNGLFHNKPMDVGVYYWVLSAKDTQGNNIIKKGDLTLLR